MSRRKTLVVGNSHVRMIRRALVNRQEAGTARADADTEVIWVKAGPEAKFGELTAEEVLERIARLSKADCLVISLLGTAHNLIGMLKHDIPFAVMETIDGPVTTEEGAQIIPMRSMQAFFENFVRREGLVHTFRSAAPCPVFHFSPPPPKARTEPPAHRKALEGDVPRVYASRQNLLALFKLERQAVQNLMRDLDIGFIDTPKCVVTSEGMLDEAFSADDMTHANAAYGELLLQIFEKLPA